MDDLGIPDFRELMYPTLRALDALGGSAHIDEISEWIIDEFRFDDAQQALRRKPDHHMSLIDYRLAWARNYLKNIGAVENSSRGVWAITEKGRSLTPETTLTGVREWKAEYNRSYYERKKSQPEAPEVKPAVDDEPSDVEAIDEDDWREDLLSVLQDMDPKSFEHLAQRLLREAGFRSVEVTGRSGDGGIDGVGTYRLSLVSFPVFFQCKRYRNSVGPGAVRDFRGAMAGRGEKGLLITTGTFTKDAKAEANRDGAPPVELIDGQDLCELLQQYSLGVQTITRTVDEVTIDPAFFADI